MKKQVEEILRGIVHPETGMNLEQARMIEGIAMSDDRIAVTLVFTKSRDPFMNSIKKQVITALEAAFPAMHGKVFVYIKETPTKAPVQKKEQHGTENVKKIIAIASGKGGVGKSTVTSNLAFTLADMGYKVGVLDADIYGPSQPRMFGTEGYMPDAEVREDGHEWIIPAQNYGIKVMSIGFFIQPDDALVWRGPMATSALRQLIHQTDWGTLDFLLVDLPPGTGDVHLTILQEMKIDGAVIVSTPQKIALTDVVRGISMFRSDKIKIPVLGIIENMAWFSPAELPANKYYIFGQGGASELALQLGLDLLGEIPVIESVMQGADEGVPAVMKSSVIAGYYRQVADNMIKNLD